LLHPVEEAWFRCIFFFAAEKLHKFRFEFRTGRRGVRE
jgi:hypothetical protein